MSGGEQECIAGHQCIYTALAPTPTYSGNPDSPETVWNCLVLIKHTMRCLEEEKSRLLNDGKNALT